VPVGRVQRVVDYFRFRFFFVITVLTDKEAEEIERRRKEGVSGGPIVLAWVDRLLADRKERVRQLQYLRQRLNQAFRYLDGLVRDVQTPRPRPGPVSRAKPLYCPSCGQPYARAYGISPDGIAYVHADGRECRMGTPVKDENSSLPR
jgi:hypothetical protein